LLKGLRAFVKEGAFVVSKQYQTVKVINDFTNSFSAPKLFEIMMSSAGTKSSA
jgi:hypothetical protein